jgi:hypothetical protein
MIPVRGPTIVLVASNNLEVAMELRLTDKEEELLRELLQEHHKHLLHEINKASHREFKTDLRNRCATVEGVIEKLYAVRAA